MAVPPPIRNPAVKYTQLFINNEFVNSASGRTFPTFNPANEMKIADIQEGNKVDVDRAVVAARAAFQPSSPWRTMDASKRGVLLNKLADLIERDAVYICSLEATDNGKPYTLVMFADLQGCVAALRYYAGWADKNQGKVVPVDGDYFCYTTREPVGVVGAITPWNYPLLMVIWKIAPALASGCTMVLKPAELTPLTVLYACSLIKEAGFPPGVVNVIPGPGHTAGAAISEHMDINKVAFTGSTAVGQVVMEAAARSNLKRVSLELGGKNPCIIMPDCDMEEAIAVNQFGAYLNMGQACTAGSRTFVHESIYDEFVKKSVEAAKKRRVGDPFDLTSDEGAQISKEHMNKILNYIDIGQREGARLLLGGKRLGNKGYFMETTVFSDVTTNMKIAKEEMFGPIMCLIKFRTLEEVIEMANNTRYGLAAGILTNNIDTYQKAADGLQAGTVWINAFHTYTVQASFGGQKMSGMGRENGEFVLNSYTELKTVYIKKKPAKM